MERGGQAKHNEAHAIDKVTVEAVALDMDGLLVDTERIFWQVGDAVLGRRGHRYSQALQARMMGRVGVASIQEMIDFHGLEDEPESLMRECDEMYSELLPKLVRPMPGLDDWMNLLRNSEIPHALTTSSRRKWVEIIFAELDWDDSFQFILTGDDVTHGKPDPEMYLTAASRFGVAPSRMLVLEDSGNGCAAGVAAGAAVVAVPNEHTAEQDFDGAVLIAKSLNDPRLHTLISG
ncbi:MAG: HAD-IA family hydrolase [Planctomycetota bacterium]